MRLVEHYGPQTTVRKGYKPAALIQATLQHVASPDTFLTFFFSYIYEYLCSKKNLPENVFRQQSSPWEALGKMYINAITDIVRDFSNHVLESIFPDDEVRANLRALLSSREQGIKYQALDSLQQILNDERGGVLQTVNHYYADTLSSIRRERVLARLEGPGFDDGDPFDKEKL